MAEDNRGQNFGFWFGLFLGGLLGALTIFFLGTKEGKKTAKRLLEKGEEVFGEIEQELGELQEKGKELVKKTEEVKEKIKEKVEGKKEGVETAVAERADAALNKMEEVQKQALATTQEVHSYFRRGGKPLS